MFTIDTEAGEKTCVPYLPTLGAPLVLVVSWSLVRVDIL
jgi:hypothetical protein